MRKWPLAAAVLAGVVALALLLSRARDDGADSAVDRAAPSAPSRPAEAVVVPASPTLGSSAAAEPAPAPAADAPPSEDGPERPGLPMRFDLVDARDGTPLVGEVVEPHVEPAATNSMSVGVRPPEGYVVWEPPTWTGRIARHARSTLWIHPLHREALVRVELVGPYGKPARDARVARFRVDGRVGTPRFEEHDRTRARGIPFLPGETLELEAGWDPPEPAPGESFVVEVEEEASFVPTERLVLPESPNDEVEAWIHLPPRPAGTLALVDHIETDNDMPYEESFGNGESAFDTGSVRVRVLSRAGERAPSVLVRIDGVGETVADERGVAVFSRVPVGARTVALFEPGRMPATASVEVVEGRTAEVVLREGEGGILSVHVVDETGAGVPFPRVEVSGGGFLFLDVDDEGVQRLDPFADVHGRRTFRHVPVGEVTVLAVAGRRRGEAKVQVREGGEHRVRVEVVPR